MSAKRRRTKPFRCPLFSVVCLFIHTELVLLSVHLRLRKICILYHTTSAAAPVIKRCSQLSRKSEITQYAYICFIVWCKEWLLSTHTYNEYIHYRGMVKMDVLVWKRYDCVQHIVFGGPFEKSL